MDSSDAGLNSSGDGLDSSDADYEASVAGHGETGLDKTVACQGETVDGHERPENQEGT